MVEMANTSTVVFVKARKSLVVQLRKKRVSWKKSHSSVEIYFFKALATVIDFG